MKTTRLFIFFIFLVCSNLLSAQSEIDSLNQQLRRLTGQDKAKVHVKIARLLREAFELEQALPHYDQAIEIREKLNDLAGVASVLNSQGIVYRELERYKEAIRSYERAREIKSLLGDQQGVALVANNLGVLYKNLEDYDRALEHYLQALEIKRDLDDRAGMSKSLNNIGIIFRELQEYDKALDYYNQSLVIKRQLNDESGISRTLNNIGVVYEQQGLFEKAREAYLQSLEIKEKRNDRRGIAATLNNIGKTHSSQNNFNSALEYYTRSMTLKTLIRDKKGMAVVCNNLGNTYTELGNFSEARKCLEKARILSREAEDLESLMRNYFFSARLHALVNDHERAYADHLQYSDLKDSLMTLQSARKTAEVAALYELEKKERELSVQEEKRSQVIWMAAISMIAILLLVTFFVLGRLRLKQKANEALILAKSRAEENDQMKSAFLANMSHEIRTPMSAILGFIDLLKDPELTASQRTKYIDIIEQGGQRMLDIINNLIDISRIESGQMDVLSSRIGVQELLEFTYEMFAPEANKRGIELRIESTLKEEKQETKTDREKVNAILSNLVKNALKYTNSGSVTMGVKSDTKNLIFYVEDTGRGIDQEKAKSIFERFNRAGDDRPGDGAGLGLAICKAYVEMLGGKIWLESELGIGSTFSFSIPLTSFDEEAVSDDHEDTISADGLQLLTVLVADDDEAMFLYLRLSLEKHCKKIIRSTNGNETVRLVKEHPEIDAVLMDIRMPALDGLTSTKKIREFNKQIIVIAQTAHAMESDRMAALAAGCDAFLSKPIKRKDLLETLAEIVQKRNSK